MRFESCGASAGMPLHIDLSTAWFSVFLIKPLRNFSSETPRSLGAVTGVRFSGELGHPFHVIDDNVVILCLDDPFIPEGRFASLLVRDQELADKLADGFEELWNKAMRDLREIDFQPGPFTTST